jgi:phage baseplate assembly protein W
MSTARADRMTETASRPRRYVDFSSGFEKSPVTGDLALVVDEESVKASVRNLVLTQKGERLFQPEVGCKVHDLLFDQLDPMTEDLMRVTIEQCVRNWEPRAQVLTVTARESTSGDGVDLTITFSVVNLPEPVTLTVFLKSVG